MKVVSVERLLDETLGITGLHGLSMAEGGNHLESRRMAVVVADLATRQADLEETLRGPSAQVAFDEQGNPTKAAVGFAAGKGLRVEDLEVTDMDGGRYVVVGPDTPERPEVEDATLVESSTNNVCFIFRLAGTPEENQAAMDGIKVYYHGDEASFNIIDANDVNSGMMHQPRGLAYWKLLHEVLQEEPVADRDRFFMYWLTHLGIEKGKRFDPDTRQRAILEEAAFVGESMAQAMVFDERHPGVLMYEGWRMVLGGERGDGIHETQRMEHWDTFDPRSRYTYEAICTSEVMCNPQPGRGMAYMAVFQDRNREWLKGEQSYRLRVPTDVPASLFWSAVCYDNRTRTLIDTDQQAATVGKKTEGLRVNEDGSVDVLFGPESPGAEWETNWVKTIPNRGWFVYFRLYGVQHAFFDRTWQLPLVEPVNFERLSK